MALSPKENCDAQNLADRPMLGEYYVGRTLGKGARAKVKQAVDRRNGREVALKVLKKAGAGNSEARTEVFVMRKYMHEARDTTNLIEMYEMLESTNHLYLVIEVMNDGDLFDTIAKGPIEEKDCKWIMRDAVSGLMHLHSIGIAHRDIKPENILVDYGRHVAKLSDFGFSKVHKNFRGEVDLSQASVGTTMYAAPEVLDPDTKYNAFQADCYSLGVTIYTALTGTFPSKTAGVHNFRKGRAAALSVEAKDLILQLMENNPNARLNAKQVLAHPWFHVDNDRDGGNSSDEVSSTERSFSG